MNPVGVFTLFLMERGSQEKKADTGAGIDL